MPTRAQYAQWNRVIVRIVGDVSNDTDCGGWPEVLRRYLKAVPEDKRVHIHSLDQRYRVFAKRHNITTQPFLMTTLIRSKPEKLPLRDFIKALEDLVTRFVQVETEPRVKGMNAHLQVAETVLKSLDDRVIRIEQLRDPIKNEIMELLEKSLGGPLI